MADFKLHCFALSGNSYKVALFFALAGMEWESIFVDYLGGETRTEEWRKTINEQGEAPVLEHGQAKISQSGVILDYLSEVTGQFGAQTAEERRDIMRWILFDNHKFTSYYATLRFIYGLQKSGETPVVEFLRLRAKAAYAIVDEHLAHGRRPADDRRPLFGGLRLHAGGYRNRSQCLSGYRSLERSHQQHAGLAPSL
ncbi:UNVERIFIED_ORG: glutathione S-transferase [Rhizobium etli]